MLRRMGRLAFVRGILCSLVTGTAPIWKNGCTIVSMTLELQRGDAGQIALLMEEHYNSRKAKQPLNKPSAGSVFKRPAGHYAGALIEQCGLKGRRVGGAAVSENTLDL